MRAWNNGGRTVSSVRGFDILYLSFLSFFLPLFIFFFFFRFQPRIVGGDAPQVSVVGSLIMAISSRFDRPSFPPRHFLLRLFTGSNGSRVARFWKELKGSRFTPPSAGHRRFRIIIIPNGECRDGALAATLR